MADSKAYKIVNKLLDQLSQQQDEKKSSSKEDKYGTKLTVLPDIQVLSENVICILGQNPRAMTLQGTNTYLIGKGKSRIMIDTGEGIESYIPILKKAMKDNNINDIQCIICTHFHFDHIGGIKSIRKAFNKDIPIYKYKNINYDNKLDLKFNNIVDKQIFKCNGATLIAHYTPGHCDDHIVIEYVEENAIFSGDCILGEGSCVFIDLYLYMLSLKKLLTFNCDIMYPGHGPKINNATKKINQYINHRNNREMQIVNALKIKNKELNGIGCDSLTLCDIVYDKTPKKLKNSAHNNLKHHLHKLVMEGKVVKDDNDKYLLIDSK